MWLPLQDLRSRGTGIAEHEGVGTGNDFWGWEFWKFVQVAAGAVQLEELVESPAPARMYWRPDKMVVEYEVRK